MYTVAFIMKRKPGMSLEDFLAYYRDRHGPRMVELIKDKGLIAYEHFPAAAQKEGRYLAEGGPAYDAVSVFSFTTEAAAEACWAIPEVISAAIALPTVSRTQYGEERFLDFGTVVRYVVRTPEGDGNEQEEQR